MRHTLYGIHHYIVTWRLTLMHQYMIYRPTGSLACDEGSCVWLIELVAPMSVMGMEYAPNSSWFDLAWFDLIPTLFKLLKADKVIRDILHKVSQKSGHFTCKFDFKNYAVTHVRLPNVTRLKALCNTHIRLHSIIESSDHGGEIIRKTINSLSRSANCLTQKGGSHFNWKVM